MGTITDSKGNVVGEFADTLGDWKQAAQIEASNRRELQIENAKLIGWLRMYCHAYGRLHDKLVLLKNELDYAGLAPSVVSILAEIGRLRKVIEGAGVRLDQGQ